MISGKFAKALSLLALLCGPTCAFAEQVTIGVLTDLSGPNSNFGGQGSVVAAEMAVQDFGGAVLGAPIKVISADHQNKPDVGLQLARRWYDIDGVNLIVDIPVSSIALAVADISKQAKKLVFSSGSSTSRLIEDSCSPYSVQWTYDAYALTNGIAATLVKGGGKKWFMITADYAAGHSIEAELEKSLSSEGGKIIGRVRHPVGTKDFSSYLLMAQASGADVIGIANFGEDTLNTIKQANEFGLVQEGKKIAVFFMSLPTIHAAGADDMKGLTFITAHVWNRNDETRAWSKRFFERHKAMPSDFQASVYSAVLSYLKAVAAVGSTDPDKVMKKVRESTVEDQFAHGGKILANGSHVHDLFLVEVKGSKEQEGPWDYMKVIRTIPGEEAFRSLKNSPCPLVTK